MTPHQTPPSVPTDEMVRAAGDVLLGRVNAPEQEIYSAAREALTAALSAIPGGVDVKPLDWQTTYVDRGDGQKEESGWEADNGFNQWYSVEMYFGTDSYGWQVKFDGDVIADHDDPERAKAAAQEHFASRILSRLTPSAIGAEGWRSCLEQARDRMQQVEDFKAGKASCLPACEAAIAHADMLLTTPPTAQEG